MKNVRLEDGIIREIIDGDLPPLHPSIAAQFFLASDDVREGEVFDHVSKASSPRVPTAAEIGVLRKAEILARLADIDVRSVRPLADGDFAYLATLRSPVAALRAELKSL